MKTLSFSLPFAGQNTKATPKPPLPDLLVVPDNVNKGQPLRCGTQVSTGEVCQPRLAEPHSAYGQGHS